MNITQGLQPDFSSSPVANSSAGPILGNGQNPLYNIWQGAIDPLIHQGPFSNVDFSGSGAYASGPNQNYSPNNFSRNPNANTPSNTGGGNPPPQNTGAGNSNQPPYAPNVQNQTVNFGGYTWKGNPGGGWSMVGQSGGNVNQYGQTADEIARAQQAYDQAVQTLQGFAPLLQNQAQTSQGAVNQSVQDTLNQAQSAEGTLQNTSNLSQARLQQQLQQALGQNNAYARSFGGLSSYGAQLNNQTNQTFGNNMANIGSQLQTGIQNLENQKVSAQKWGQNQIAGIQNQLAQGLQQIALNVNQTDIQKANAVTSIQQQAQAQINNINSVLAQLQSNIEASRQQALQYAALFGNTNSQIGQNIAQIANSFANQANQTVPQILMPGGLYGTEKLYGSNLPNQ